MKRMLVLLLTLGLATLGSPVWAESHGDAPMEEMSNESSSMQEMATETPAQEEMAKEMEAAEPMSSEAAPMAASTGKVNRAQFTTQVSDREPMDQVSQVADTVTPLYFFTELTNMKGQRVTHRWEYNGQVMAEVGFNVRGPRWRVWSTKTMMPYWHGVWTVKVVNEAGDELASQTLTYGE